MSPDSAHDPLAFKDAPALSPASPEAPATPPEEKKRGCLKLGGGCGCVGCALVVIACAGLFFAVMAWLKSSDVYRTAFERVASDPAVRERLGEPVRAGFFVEGSITFGEKGSGGAELRFRVRGPRDSARVSASAVMTGGEWSLTDLTVIINSTGETLVLVGAADAAEEF
jgi:hypothetical protein